MFWITTRHIRQSFATGFVFIMLIGPGSVVYGQQDTQTKHEKMLQISDEATEDVLDGRYEQGAQKFQRAYDVFPDPVLLKNMMVAWFRADNCAKAIPAANEFLASGDVSEDDLHDVNRVRTTCKIKIAREAIGAHDFGVAERALRRASALASTDDDKHTIQALQSKLDEEQEALTVDSASTPQGDMGFEAIDQSHRTDTRTSSTNWLGWGLTGTGAATATATVVYHFISLDRQQEYIMLGEQGDPATYSLWQERQSQLETARWLIPTLYTLSGAITASGISVLVFRSQANPTHEKVLEARLVPVLSRTSPGVRLHINF